MTDKAVPITLLKVIVNHEARATHEEVKRMAAELISLRAGGVQALSEVPAVPAGWKLVPVEPTLAMIDAALAVDPAHESVWAAYLAASPTPPAEQQATCTNSDSWNCKYCNKTKTCAALANAGQPPAPKAAPNFGPLRDADAEYGKQLSVYNTPKAEQQATTEAATPKGDATTEAALGVEPGAVYAELPRAGAIGYASVVDVDRYATHMAIGPHLPGVRDIALWTTDQSRDFADRTHALRVSSGKANANGLR